MKRSTIKKMIFAIAGFTTLPLLANENRMEDLMLVEDLPVEQRVVVHEKVIQFMIENPEIASSVKIIAIDKEGKVYVLDEHLAKIKSLGAPSSISSSR